jgi:hypothetical protein
MSSAGPGEGRTARPGQAPIGLGSAHAIGTVTRALHAAADVHVDVTGSVDQLEDGSDHRFRRRFPGRDDIATGPHATTMAPTSPISELVCTGEGGRRMSRAIREAAAWSSGEVECWPAGDRPRKAQLEGPSRATGA